MAKKRRIKYGVEKAAYAVLNVDDTGVYSYETPVPMPGVRSVTLDQQGDENEFFADNISWYTSYTNNGYSGNVEFVELPEEFRTDVLKEELDPKDKVLMENANAEPEAFAFLFLVRTSEGKNICKVFFNCKCSRPGHSANTKESSINPDFDTLSLNAKPLEDGIVRASTTEATPDSVIAAWFGEVWLPDPVQTP